MTSILPKLRLTVWLIIDKSITTERTSEFPSVRVFSLDYSFSYLRYFPPKVTNAQLHFLLTENIIKDNQSILSVKFSNDFGVKVMKVK
jgi:hypothetical protein